MEKKNEKNTKTNKIFAVILFHKHYVPVAMHEAVEVEYNLFCAIRLRLRPNFKRHRKVLFCFFVCLILTFQLKSRSSKKWSHLECPDCTHLRNGITKAICALKKTFEKSAAEIDRLIQAKRNLEEKLDVIIPLLMEIT